MAAKKLISLVMNRRIKNILEYCMPHGILLKIRSKNNKNYFLEGYENYLIDRDRGCAETTGNPFKSLVSVVGLGYSGSGAILDFLCELDNCEVLGTDKDAKTIGIDHKGSFEANFLRFAGGLFEFEKYLNTNNLFQNDALLNRFIKLANNFKLFKNDINVRRIFYDFFDKVVDQRIMKVKGLPYNPHLNAYDKSSSIFFLKDLSIDNFYSESQSFLRTFFSYLNANRKDYLVIDQLFADYSFDVDHYNKYIPNCKIIVSYRDPRDVYAMAIKHHIDWIAHSNVEEFLQWYRRCVKNLNLNSTQYLVVQFERLVNDYEKESSRILDFLGIDNVFHNPSLKKAFFNPEVSKVNIGIWAQLENYKDDFEIINKSLPLYCYNK